MNHEQQARYEARFIRAWWACLPVARRWKLCAKYGDVGDDSWLARVFKAEGHRVKPFPHGFFDPPSACQCVECEP